MKLIALTLAGTVAAVGGYNFTHVTNLVKAPFKSTPVENVTIPASPVTILPVTNLAPLTEKTVEKHTVSKDRVLYLDEEVDFPITNELINRIQELNAKSSDDIWLNIDSPGGSVLDGALLISAMQASKAHVNTVCTRLCASMAAMIHSYGYKRYGVDRSILMYHPASGGAQGQVPNMFSQLSTLMKYLDRMVDHQVSRSKLTHEEFNRRVAYEVWEEAEDSIVEGFNDGLVSLNVPYYQPPQRQLMPLPQEVKIPPGNRVEFKWIAPDSELHFWNRNSHAR